MSERIKELRIGKARFRGVFSPKSKAGFWTITSCYDGTGGWRTWGKYHAEYAANAAWADLEFEAGRPQEQPTQEKETEMKERKARSKKETTQPLNAGLADGLPGGADPAKNPVTVEQPIDHITPDNHYMVRANLDTETIKTYAEAMQEGVTFPPIDLFTLPNGSIVIVDGWHRYQAALKVGFTSIPARFYNGTPEEALTAALKANQTHGLRRSNADKRRSVEMALAAFPEISSRSIAELCGVSHDFAATVRTQVSTVDTCGKRKGKDGKAYPSRIPRGGGAGSGAASGTRDPARDQEREDARKDRSESAGTDQEDLQERRRAEWADWNAFEDAAAAARDGISTMESLHIEAKRKEMAASICTQLAERLTKIATRLAD
jgi:hypothetical protein